MATASPGAELELLDRVLLRFATAETSDQLEATLAKFLPPVLLKLPSSDPAVRAKALEVLSHVNKRTKAQPVRLPTEALLAQLQDKATPPFAANFALLYLDSAFPREDKQLQVRLVESLVGLLPGRAPPQQATLLRLLTPLLPVVPLPQDRDQRRTVLGLDKLPEARGLLVRHLQDVLLCDYSSHSAVAQAAKDPAAVLAVPGGLSAEALRRVTNEGTQAVTSALKIGCVEFLASNVCPPSEVLCGLVVAAADSHHAVAAAAEAGLKRLGTLDLENEQLVKGLYGLLQGTMAPQGQKELPADSRRLAVQGKSRQLVLGYLVKSTKATNMFPSVVQVMFDCLFGAGTTPRLQALGLQLMQSACERGHDNLLKATGPVLLQGLRRLLGSVHSEAPDHVKLRATIYLLLGKLAKRQPGLFARDLGVLGLLFGALEQEPSSMRFSLVEAIQMLATCYRGAAGSTEDELTRLLLKAVQSAHGHLRLVAVQSCLAIFPLAHVPSRYICMLGAGDAQEDIREEARRGLRRPHANHQPQVGTKVEAVLPRFPELVSYVMAQSVVRYQDAALRYQTGVGALPFSPPVHAAVLDFLRKALAADCGHPYPEAEDREESEEAGEQRRRAVQAYLQALPPPAAQAEAQPALQLESAAGWQSGNVLDEYCTLVELGLGPAASSDLQRVAASCLQELVEALPELVSPRLLLRLLWLRGFVSAPNEVLRQHMCTVLGVVAARARADELAALLTDLCGVLEDTAKPVAESHLGALCAVGEVVGQCVAMGQNGQVPALARSVEAVARCVDLGRTELCLAACQALGRMGRQGPLPLEAGPVVTYTSEVLVGGTAPGDKLGPGVTLGEVVGQLLHAVAKAKDPKVRDAAVSALGLLGAGDGQLAGAEAVLAGLYATQREKSPDLHFSVGLALARLGAPGPGDVSASTEGPAGRLPSILEQLLANAASLVPPVRQSACIWLLTLLKHNPHHPAVQVRLRAIQEAFTAFLGDADEFTQECASTGLGLVYECGSAGMRKELVDALVGTLTSGTKQQKVAPDTQLFTQDMGTAPGGGALSTYKDLCSLVSELNKPDLIYKFMALSHHNALWNSRKGAAFGFSTIATMAGEQLEEHLPGLVPKLYRYRQDPNQRTRQAMAQIWKALGLDSGHTVKRFRAEILADLQENIVAKQWRTREASCLALGDYLNTLQLDLPTADLQALWPLCFRALDDIKESVRVAGTVCSKALASITRKKCDPAVTASRDTCRAVLETALPLLLDQGLRSAVKEVQALSMHTLQELCKVAGPQLRPYAADLVVSMLQSQSELESASLNYLAFHIDKYDLDREQFEDARVAASRLSPMADTVELALAQVDDSVLAGLVPRLLELVRGIGLQTKVGAAQVLASLADGQRGLQLGRHVGGILRTLQLCLADPSPTVRKACGNSVSYVVKAAGDKDMEGLVATLTNMALHTDEGPQQHSSAFTCQQIAHHAPDMFRRWATSFLPLAFVAMHVGGDAKAVWASVWDDNTPGSRAGQRLYRQEIVGLLVQLFAASSWERKRMAGAAAATLAEGAGEALGPLGATLLGALLDGLAGRTWDGKEALVLATGRLAAACAATMLREGTVGLDAVARALVRECGKKQLGYRQAALTALADLLDADKTARYDEVRPVLVAACAVAGEEEEDSDDEAARAKARPLVAKVQQAAYTALGRAWPADTQAQRGHVDTHLGLLLQGVAHVEWPVQVAALGALRLFVAHTPQLGPGTVVGPLVGALQQAGEGTAYTAVRLAVLDVVAALLQGLQDGGAGLVGSMQQQQLLALLGRLHSDVDATVRTRADALMAQLRRLTALF